MGETTQWITTQQKTPSETKLCISKKDGTLLTSSRHMLIMSGASPKQTQERKKVMKTIKSYFEPLTLTLVWVYAMAVFAVAMDIFVWRA